MESQPEMSLVGATGTSQTKKCTVCGNDCSVSLFHRNAKSPDGLDNRCAPCKADQKRLALYDLPPEEYKRLLFLQNCECAICRRGLPELDHGLVVDHDHGTGKVRSLLCGGCNSMIGYGGEDPDRMRRGAEYIEVFNREGGYNE